MSDREFKPLPIWCADGELDAHSMARVRNAKLELWLDYQVRPEHAEGSIEGRVFAWGSTPPFLCSYALVDPLGTDKELADALAWVLYEGECAAAVELEHYVGVLFGPGTREVLPAELEAEQRFADYEGGR